MSTLANPQVWGLGRRKSAVARVRLKSGQGAFTVNGHGLLEYFKTPENIERAKLPLKVAGVLESYDVAATVHGGGLMGQADAVRLGLSRALRESNPVVAPALNAEKLFRRDQRMKERKKPGRKGARRGFQFSKR